MEYGSVKLRHELKYYINWGEYELLKSRILPVMQMDENTQRPEGYHIRSLYFDDMYDTALHEKLIGDQRRNKYRIRIYEISDKVIKFERKSKYDAYISKVSASITRTQVEDMLAGDYTSLIRSDNPYLHEIYAKRNVSLLRPSIIVDYLREAYILREGNVRITFDKFISAGVGSFQIFDKEIPVFPVVDKGQLVLEIKYDDYLPSVIQNLVRSLTGDITAISKFVMCRKRLSDIKQVSRRVVTSING